MELSAKQENDFEALPLKLAYSFLAGNGFAKGADEIKRSPERLGSYTSSLRRAKIVALFKKNNLLQKFIETNWPFGASAGGQRKIKLYEQIYSRYERAASKLVDSSESSTRSEDGNGAGKEFVFEEQLRDYLAENLSILEPGLTLWLVDNGDAVEFQVDDQGPSRRIDILAKDRNNLPVVIELKVSRGHEKTVGQALYYRARIKKLFGVQRVRIFIVASEISPELSTAASEVPDVVLFEYSLGVTVNIISN